IFLGHALSPASAIDLTQSGEVAELVSDLRVTLRRLVSADSCGSKLACVLLVKGQSTLKSLSTDRRSSGALLKDRKSPISIEEVGRQFCIRQPHLLQSRLVRRVGQGRSLGGQIHARLKLRWAHVAGDPGGEIIVTVVEADRQAGLPHDLTVRVLHRDVLGRRQNRQTSLEACLVGREPLLVLRRVLEQNADGISTISILHVVVDLASQGLQTILPEQGV